MWEPTDKHVYGAIYREHNWQLVTFASFTNMEPSELGSPEILTEWGFKGASAPLIKYQLRWEHGRREDTEQAHYWIWREHRQIGED
jgi:hypothetical protein